MSQQKSKQKGKVKKTTLSDFESFKLLLESGKKLTFEVATGSMSPLIRVGQKVELVASNLDLKVFDIVVFLSRGFLICHCVIHINRMADSTSKSLLITRGINSSVEDLPISSAEILGKVVSHQISFLMKLRFVLQSWSKRVRRGVL